ncbi:hypothetical protein DSM107010_64100 [Chroococcidiopsis cubana SAG 39.79]|uniref:Uncharacterized protein n=1 Tax=Chroococcidiopsis cubana SAG 39.79 TaxID=388085 RepID=A0AB37U9N1_9CYAN|nr:hypothetical protein C7B79_11360 [Chroococcidiopsis cubana CCALA 043]RUT01938.1 hypothetical protein DSM107010_64100 [Chroococcidiopsis cubana SAG 39.79]
MTVETAFALALMWLWIFRILNFSAVNGNIFLTLYLQSRVIASEINGIAINLAVLRQIEQQQRI